MNKRIGLLVFFIAILLPLTGCNKSTVDKNNNIEIDYKQSGKEVKESSTKLHLDGEIIKVSISKSKGFNKINSDFIETFKDDEEIEVFKKIISSANKEDGIVDMVEPEFDLEVTYDTGSNQGFHLWLGKDGEISSLMKVDDTHTIYTIPEKMNNKLIDLMK